MDTHETAASLVPTTGTDVPPVIAANEKITLTDEHWIFINWLREKFKEDGQTPNFRNMVSQLEEDHPGTDWKKKLYDLFPNQPARQGVVLAQSRLGQLLCRDCGNSRDRRIGLDLLRQAARAGDPLAQLEFGRICVESGRGEEEQARHWLEQAAAQGSSEARRLPSAAGLSGSRASGPWRVKRSMARPGGMSRSGSI